MKVLLSVASFLPGYGGPALSVSRLGSALVVAGAEVGLFAPDGSAETSPIVADALRLADGGPIMPLPARLETAFASFGPDVVHDNGIWLPHNHALAQAAVRYRLPRIVSTRGMLEPWAFRYKAWKKRLAWILYQKRDLENATALHATADEEAYNLTHFSLKIPITVAPNGVDVPETLASMERVGRPRTILFLGRIHPKKGLPLLIEAFARLSPNDWRVVIAGPDELDHTAELKALVAEKGISNAFRFVGPQYGEAKAALFAEADFFVLPTYSENFGLAIAEALAHAVPVVTTTGTPWSMLEHEGCGYWVAPTTDAVTEAVGMMLSLGDEARANMGQRGRSLVAERFGWDGIATTLLELYRNSLVA